MVTVVGLDLSLTSTGIAIALPASVEVSGHIVQTHRVKSAGKKDDTWAMRSARLTGLSWDIVRPIPRTSLVMLEAPSYSSVGGSQHDRSGLWWIVYQELKAKGCTVVPVAPTQRVMYALGKGGGKDAGKDAVLAAAVKRYEDIEITGNDVADAVILMAMGLRLSGHPIDDVPVSHRRALTKLDRVS